MNAAGSLAAQQQALLQALFLPRHADAIKMVAAHACPQRAGGQKHLERGLQAYRSNGDLGLAKLELLKAKDLAPANEDVRTLLASVQAELGEPIGTITTYDQEQNRLALIGEERARTSVRTQLQKA